MILFAAVVDPLLIKNLATMRTNQARNFPKNNGCAENGYSLDGIFGR